MNPALAMKDDFIVVDINAIHSISLAFCNCEHAQQRYVQLLCAGLYLATVLDPKTAATFHVLKHFQMLSFMSKVSAFEFYYSIA
jgi:CxC2 like cysteine cluster associated with KDZ transposases